MLWTIFIGFLIGVAAKFFMPGTSPGGFIATVLLGIGGAMLVNFLGNGFGFYQYGEFSSFFAAVIGSMVILFIYAVLTRKKKY